MQSLLPCSLLLHPPSAASLLFKVIAECVCGVYRTSIQSSDEEKWLTTCTAEAVLSRQPLMDPVPSPFPFGRYQSPGTDVYALALARESLRAHQSSHQASSTPSHTHSLCICQRRETPIYQIKETAAFKAPKTTEEENLN